VASASSAASSSASRTPITSVSRGADLNRSWASRSRSVSLRYRAGSATASLSNAST
jgi:hypothetical protein